LFAFASAFNYCSFCNSQRNFLLACFFLHSPPSLHSFLPSYSSFFPYNYIHFIVCSMIAAAPPLRTTSFSSLSLLSSSSSGPSSHNPIRREFVAFFNLGFRFLTPRPLTELHALPASSIRMEWLSKKGGGCFRSNQGKDVIKFEADSGGVDIFDAAPRAVPDHLVIMVNGLVGSAADWGYAAEQFVKKLPDKVIVHRSECNSSKLTFDGVDLTGERLAEEVFGVGCCEA
ncbi:hypothetical protein F2P56_025778, partial [Juglans regia]